MVKKIALLETEVINQIAAGEVLENPASAVKEMIENSIDAGSFQIDVEISGGGHQLIRIEDDGTGMGRGDAIECLQRHATSKIRQTDDLLQLSTMGFRGEALAAIASISELEIQTSDDVESTRLRSEGGKIISIEPCARNRGTTIDVRSLFYNTPARQKFQKSPSSSAAHVLKVIQTLALAHPEISFSLKSNEKAVFKVENDLDWRTRCKKILGSLAHEVTHEIGTYSVRGLIGSPEEAKGNRSGQYLYLNRRPIFSPLVARAVKQGYSTRLNDSVYPSFILFLELPPAEFDINVHPQKRDVRFQDDSKVFRLVERGVFKAFEPMSQVEFSEPLQFTRPEMEAPAPLPWTFREEFQPTFIEEKKSLYPIAVIGSMALFSGEFFTLIDLKGAESRILFESSQKKGAASQSLIWPIEIELSGEEGENWAEELKEIGIEARLLAPRLLAIDALPIGVEASDVADLIARYKIDRKGASAICRFCRARKKQFSLEEASLIERRLAECSDPIYDPLGRLIIRKVNEEDLIQWLTS